jgi:uncharacterized membrane protein YhhN
MPVFVLIAAPLLLAGLIFFEKKESVLGKLAFKPPLSLLFILVAVMADWPDRTFGCWIVAGLVASFVGDVCLIFSARNMFLAGLVSFLVGHIFYVFGFYTLAALNTWTWIGAVLVIIAAVPVWRWLKPHLGNMRGPVLAYILIISLMVSGAFSVLGDGRWEAIGRHLVFWGAIVFYLSDLFVARQRFVAQGIVNRAVGLPLYYAGQFALALATAHIGGP